MNEYHDILTESNLKNLVYRGKVRDTHDMGDDVLLMVSTDRVSAYDVVIPTPIPGKGAVLNQMAHFWFGKTENIVPNHLLNHQSDEYPPLPSGIQRRSMYVKKADRIDVECVARGYITGSAFQEYQQTGTIANVMMPKNMVEGDKFPEPIFTPATKAEEGHDENISISEMSNIVGNDLTQQLKDITLKIYNYAHRFCLEKGIIIADTKLEFGIIDGQVTLIDELLTPDSSRFWDASLYSPGHSQPNFDKQFVRDWLNSQDWDREPPAPALPAEIVKKTQMRYEEAFSKITGCKLK
jgi:phosphoribosylaminoimidazole-succinocarboxamide synthase